MRRYHFLYLLFVAALCGGSYSSIAQGNSSIAIIPAFHDRLNSSGIEDPVRLTNQRFVIFVYRNAVAVYSEAKLVNNGADTIVRELSLPSTGHRSSCPENGPAVSSGILSVRMWLEGFRISPEIVRSDEADWYTIPVKFVPGIQQTVKAVFWAETSLTDIDSLPGLDTLTIPPGPRGFMIDLSHAAIWNDVIHAVDITVVLRGGLTFDGDSVGAQPASYSLSDSVFAWQFRDIEPGPADDPVVRYSPSGPWPFAANTMARLSEYIVTRAYDELLGTVDQTDR